MRPVTLASLLAAPFPRESRVPGDKLVFIGLAPPRLAPIGLAPIGLAPMRLAPPGAPEASPLVLLVLPARLPEGESAIPSAGFNPDDPNRFGALDAVREAVAAHGGCRVLFDLPLSLIAPRWLEQLATAGVSRFFLPAFPGRFLETDARRARRLVALPHAGRRGLTRSLEGLGHAALQAYNAANGGCGSAALLRLLAWTEAEGRPPHRFYAKVLDTPQPRLERPVGDLRVTHLIGTLGPGGAERQLCYALRGLARRGFIRPSLLTFSPLTGDAGHYLPLLDGVAVPRHVLPHPLACDMALFARLPLRLRYLMYAAYRWFTEHPTDILHAWMDYSAIIGGLGALLAGVPRVILSSRSVAPPRFDYYAHWHRPWYGLMARNNRVFFLNNTKRGAADYTRWLGLPPERFTVIPNAVDTGSYPLPTPRAVAALRGELGLGADTPLITGVFRLSAEKRPEVFAAVLAGLLDRVPEARAAHAGIGPMEGELRAALARAGIADKVTLLGRRDDIPTLLGASTALLLTSTQEGMPNVLLEAQLCGCPVVATRVGGAAECLLHGQTGLLHAEGDIAGMAASLAMLATDGRRREAMGEAGARYVRDTFSLDAALDRLTDFYHHVARPPS